MESIKRIFEFPKPILSVYPIIWILSFLVLISADLATKKWITGTLNFSLTGEQMRNGIAGKVQALMENKSQIDILGEDGRLIKLKLVFNDRFVFGSGPAAPRIGLLLSFFAIIFLFFYRLHNPDFGPQTAWLFVFSGAAGNLIDKMFVKSMETGDWVFSFQALPNHVTGVVDFVECIWFGWDAASDYYLTFLAWPSWPTFNLADSLIVVGTIVLALSMFLPPRREA